MNELRDLYQEVILDHVKRPRNSGVLAGASHRADGDNPLCGDKVTIFLSIEDGRIADVRFQGSGCAISLASASLMTEAIKGKTEAEAIAAKPLADLDKTWAANDQAAANMVKQVYNSFIRS